MAKKGKWIGGGSGPFSGSHWTWTPYLAGGDDPSLPPPQVGSNYHEGPMYRGGVPPGGDFKTWIVISPNGKTLQQIINWKSGPEKANPYADWYKQP